MSTLQKSKLFVSNLKLHVCYAQLDEMFEPFGLIAQTVLETNDDDVSLGRATVEFEDRESAKRAIKELHGKPHANSTSKLIVKYFLSPEELRSMNNTPTNVEGKDLTTINIGGLEGYANEVKLREIFCIYGAIEDLKVFKNFAVLKFDNEESAEAAIREKNNAKMDGKPMRVQYNKNPKPAQIKKELEEPKINKKCLFVGNLDRSVENETLVKIFSVLGTVPLHSSIVLKNPNGTSRGCGFLNYGSEEDAAKALDYFMMLKEKKIVDSLRMTIKYRENLKK